MSEPIDDWNQPVPACPPDLFDAPPPVISVYLTTAGARPDAAEQVALRWKTLRRRLRDDGAPESALAEVDPLMERAHAHGETLVAIADAARLRYVANLPELPEQDLGVVGPLPHLVPLVAATQRMVPHIVVAIDRIGAELVAVLPAKPDLHAEVAGRDLHITRSAPGGWSQRRFQQRAENRWEANAREVADELTRLVDATAPRLVVVSGDVRAVAFLREHVPARVSSLLMEVQGDYSGLDEALRRSGDVVTAIVDEETAALLADYERERGEDDLSSVGPSETLEALARGQVGTLLLDPSRTVTHTAWFGPEPAQVASCPEDLERVGVVDPTEAPLDDVLIRAAVTTAAKVRITPPGVGQLAPSGVGGLLRFRV
jgi:hypothetical protein